MIAERDREASSGVQLAEVVAAITLAADLALGQPLDHVLRSGAIAVRLAEQLGLSDEERAATYWVTMFISPGCSVGSFELSQIFGDDIALRSELYSAGWSSREEMKVIFRRAGGGGSAGKKARARTKLIATRGSAVQATLGAHCAVNVRLAQRIGMNEVVTSALAHSFARWDGKGIPKKVRGTDIALPVRIASVADAIEVSHRQRGAEGAIEVPRAHSGTLFDPAVVDAWVAISSDVLPTLAEESWRAGASSWPDRSLTVDELDEALELLADYADLKSPWFSGHSRGVAVLAESAAREAGLPESDVITLRHAALLHDIGRNGVPNSIWDKPGPLTDDERERVRLHAYHTDRVLHRAGSLARLASIASAAHERADGGGYPRAISAETIPLLGRLLECADAYHAMCEDRPHRPALTRDAAAQELRRAARAGELDGRAVDAVLAAAGHPPRKRPSAPAGLTPREVEVLELAARGATTRQVASKLGITPKTAGNHIERIYVKIGVSSRAEAALFAMQNGLLRTLER